MALYLSPKTMFNTWTKVVASLVTSRGGGGKRENVPRGEVTWGVGGSGGVTV